MKGYWKGGRKTRRKRGVREEGRMKRGRKGYRKEGKKEGRKKVEIPTSYLNNIQSYNCGETGAFYDHIILVESNI